MRRIIYFVIILMLVCTNVSYAEKDSERYPIPLLSTYSTVISTIHTPLKNPRKLEQFKKVTRHFRFTKLSGNEYFFMPKDDGIHRWGSMGMQWGVLANYDTNEVRMVLVVNASTTKLQGPCYMSSIEIKAPQSIRIYIEPASISRNYNYGYNETAYIGLVGKDKNALLANALTSMLAIGPEKSSYVIHGRLRTGRRFDKGDYRGMKDAAELFQVLSS